MKIRHLEGLRGIASLFVVFFHLEYTCFLTQHEHLNSLIWELHTYRIIKRFFIDAINIIFDGDLAVWIFWVLSSYVISILFFKPSDNYDKVVVGYTSKRYLRLLIPVLASILFAYVLLKFGVIFNNQLAAFQGPPYSGGWLDSLYNFEANIFMALRSAFFEAFFNYRFETTYNCVLWTIQYEFLGSLFTFSIFGIIRHNRRRFILYFIILLIVLKLKLLWLFSFVVGHVLCDYEFSNYHDRVLRTLRTLESKIHRFNIPVFIISMILIIFGKSILSYLKFSYDYQNLFLSIFIVYICIKNKIFQSLFSGKIPFWLGSISFSMYLIHIPILCSLTSYLILTHYSLTAKIIIALFTLLVVFILSHFFNKYIDRKGIVYANKIGDYFKRHT